MLSDFRPGIFFLFTVDVLNEAGCAGKRCPILRPTDSLTVFLQQLGRDCVAPGRIV
jgi:hypothetical protein